MIKENEVSIQGKVSIGATVTYTDENKKSPAVVIIMGTGKTDRDGNDKGFHTDLYKNLAKMFAELGFVAVRYDKRGTYKTDGSYNSAGLCDLTDDAISVVQYTKKLPYVDETKVIVCGHSEGTMIATLLSDIEYTTGLILLGGAGTCMKDALYYQNRLAVNKFQNKKGLIGVIIRKSMTQEKADAKVNAMFEKCSETDKDRLFFGGSILNAKWIREHNSYTSEDFVSLLKKYGKPVLAITGKADLSADFRQLELLKDVPFIECYAPEKVNHILRVVDDNNSMMTVKKQYLRLSKQPVHSEIKEKISSWLKSL